MDAESETLIPTGGGFDVAGTLNANGKAAGSATQQDAESNLIIPIQEVGERTHSGGEGQNGCGIGNPGDPMFTLQAQAQHAISVGLGSDPLHADEVAQPVTNRNGYPGVVAFSCKDHGGDAGSVSPTLRSMAHDRSHANAGGHVAVKQGMAVRRLTPRECERLQGFPDDYTLIKMSRATKRAVEEEMRAYFLRTHQEFTEDDLRRLAADGPRYKALGNSMAVPVMRWIGRRIELVQSGERTAANE